MQEDHQINEFTEILRITEEFQVLHILILGEVFVSERANHTVDALGFPRE